MSHSDRPKPDVNATIQLDQLDAEQVRLEDEPPVASRRVTPPPLPPEVRASAAPASVSVAPRPSAPPPRSKGKTVVYGAIFVVLIAIAIVGGLKVGGLAHDAPTPSASLAAAPKATPAPTPSASASVAKPMQTITIPTIEMR